ncbi:MAG: molybdenum cofactor guanylyltransferase [Burkholderiaceae bacterium]|nr:molybdenum cofactor guanylyltransferase [Burkholderiaceae bacterium]
MIERADITGVVLAGGLGRRMSSDGAGVDKGLQPLRGRPMVAHVIARFEPQVGRLIVNANRNRQRYAEFGFPVWGDSIEGFAGPLAGIEAGLAHCETPYLATAPCDTPFIPLDLVSRLACAVESAGAALAVAHTGTRSHPVFMLVERSQLEGLRSFLASGRRRIDAWYAGLATVSVDFGDEQAFSNINTLDELSRYDVR